MVAIPISSVIGGPVSGLLLSMDGIAGLAGWQWLFIIEGLPAVFVGLSLLWLMADTPREHGVADRRGEADRPRIVCSPSSARTRCRRLSVAIVDLRVLILAGIQFGFLVGSYGIGIFMPQILDTSAGCRTSQIGFVTSGCYLVASIGMILWAGYVDRGHSKVMNLAARLRAVGEWAFSARSSLQTTCGSRSCGWPWRSRASTARAPSSGRFLRGS